MKNENKKQGKYPNKRSSNRTKSGGPKNDRYDSHPKGKESSFCGDNHPEWYITNDVQAEAVANLPFGRPAGLPMDTIPGVGYFEDKLSTSAQWKPTRSLPGVAVIEYVPTVGDTGDDPYTSAINLAAQAAYTTIRRSNAGAKNYEPADYAIYLAAMDSIYQAYMIGVRAYKSMFAYNALNRNYPRMLVEAQGFDFNDLNANLAGFRALLEQVRAYIAQMVVPNVYTLFTRHEFVTSTLFTDDGLNKGQIYLMKPAGLFKYTSTGETGSRLEFRGFNSPLVGEFYETRFTYEDYRTYLFELVNAVVSDIDCAIMSGDIRKAFEGNFYELPKFDPDNKIELLYDPRFLVQVHNAILQGHTIDASIYQVIPDPEEGAPYIETNYVFEGIVPATHYQTLDIPSDNVTYKDVVSAVRLKSGWGSCVFVTSEPLGDHYEHIAHTVGSEICTEMIIYSLSNDYPGYRYTVVKSWNPLYDSGNSDSGSSSANASIHDRVSQTYGIMDYMQLAWAPYMYHLVVRGSSNPTTAHVDAAGVLGVFSNTTQIDVHSTLRNIFDMGWAKMFNINSQP